VKAVSKIVVRKNPNSKKDEYCMSNIAVSNIAVRNIAVTVSNTAVSNTAVSNTAVSNILKQTVTVSKKRNKKKLYEIYC
jgi:hypothetical protein